MSKKANFDCVKFQKRDINIVYSKDVLDSPRESPWGKTQRDQKIGLEFNKEEYDEINDYCKKIDIKWFASAWDLNSLNFIDQYNLDYNKIASAMIVDSSFLREVANRNKHTFISTIPHDIITLKIFTEENEKVNLVGQLIKKDIIVM